jgi:hypothetical protein
LQSGISGSEFVYLGLKPLGSGQRYGIQAFQFPCRRFKQDDIPLLPQRNFSLSLD